MATVRRPAEVFPPGEFLRDELEARGWTQAEFADILGRPAPVINEILSAKRRISPEIALDLAQALGTTPELWLNLESSYQLANQLAKVDPNEGQNVARRAKLYSLAPVKEMCRRRWIEPSDNPAVLEKRVLDFFEISSLDEKPQLEHAARKSTSYQADMTAVQLAWLYRAHHLAKAVHVASFTRPKLKLCIERLQTLKHTPEEVRHVPRILAEAGIRFVIVQPFQRSKIDGACLTGELNPTIAMTLRFDRLDNFWFVLMHEIGHLVNGDAVSLDVELDPEDKDERPECERAADEFAMESLIPQDKLDGFVARVGPIYTMKNIEGFAKTMKVHPAIVVGQLQHRREISYASFRNVLKPVRKIVAGSALTDGWDVSLPAGIS